MPMHSTELYVRYQVQRKTFLWMSSANIIVLAVVTSKYRQHKFCPITYDGAIKEAISLLQMNAEVRKKL